MRFSITFWVVLATSGPAQASWGNWMRDVTVTETATRSIQSCPCNGEVRELQAPRDEGDQPFGGPGPGFPPFGPPGQPGHPGPPGQPGQPPFPRPPFPGPPFPGFNGYTIVSVTPIVVVYDNARETGNIFKLQPNRGHRGPQIATTILSGPLAANHPGWFPGGHTTQTTTIHSSVPTTTGPHNGPAPWSDWGWPSHPTKSSSFTPTSTSLQTTSSSSSGGPIGRSTTSSTGSSSSSTSSTSAPSTSSVATSSTTSGGNGGGPVGGSTSSSTTSSSSSSTSSTTTESSSASSATSSNGVGPIGGSTTSSSTSTPSTFSTSFVTSSTSSSTTESSSSSTDTTSSSSTSIASSSSSSTDSSTSTTTGTSTSSTAVTTTTSSISSVAPSSTTTSAPPSVVTDDVSALNYMNGILEAHNVHRRNHSAADLTWSDSLANTAQKLAATCVYGHNTNLDGGGYGQNIGAGYTQARVPSMIGNSMYNNEMENYPSDYGNPNPDMTNFENWGHFSQIVWRATTQVGCATQQCSGGLSGADGVPPSFTVCNYMPPGNIQGAYDQVGAPLGQPYTVISPV